MLGRRAYSTSCDSLRQHRPTLATQHYTSVPEARVRQPEPIQQGAPAARLPPSTPVSPWRSFGRPRTLQTARRSFSVPAHRPDMQARIHRVPPTHHACLRFPAMRYALPTPRGSAQLDASRRTCLPWKCPNTGTCHQELAVDVPFILRH